MRRAGSLAAVLCCAPKSLSPLYELFRAAHVTEAAPAGLTTSDMLCPSTYAAWPRRSRRRGCSERGGIRGRLQAQALFGGLFGGSDKKNKDAKRAEEPEEEEEEPPRRIEVKGDSAEAKLLREAVLGASAGIRCVRRHHIGGLANIFKCIIC